MLLIDFNYWVLILFLICFAFYSVKLASHIFTPKGYFHDERPRNNEISLTAANLTLGTGLAYHISGTQNNGVLWLMIPLATGYGYYLLSKFLKHVNASARKGKNFFFSINEQIEEQTGQPSPFAKVISISLISIYSLALSFEIYASGSIIKPLFFAEASKLQEASVSFLIFSITAFYALFGGIRVVFKTDKIQILIIYVFLPVLLISSLVTSGDINFTQTLTNSWKFGVNNIVAVILASLAAIMTQFYNLLNWAAVSHLQLAEQENSFKKVGKRVTILLLAFCVIGLLLPPESNNILLSGFNSTFLGNSWHSNILATITSSIIVIGLSSILITTIDSLLITISMFYYDNILRRDSKDQNESPHELRAIRIIGLTSLLLVFTVLTYLNFLQPKIFLLLLVFSGAVVVFAPFLFITGLLSFEKNRLKSITHKVIYLYFFIFVLSGVSGVLILNLKPTFIPYFGVTTFLVSSFISFFIYKKS